MIPMNKTLLTALCAAFTLFTHAPLLHAASDRLPDLGDVGTDSLSLQDEKRLGRRAMEQIRATTGIGYFEDAEINAWLQSLGDRLVAASGKAGEPFEFFLLDDPTLNAFAMPGGYIGVHTGLIDATRNESELAGVLSHEISHVNQRHIAQLIGKQGGTNLMMLAAVLAAVLAARSNPDVSQAAIVSAQAGAIQNQLAYSRSFEHDADRTGLAILDRAGFDPRGMVTFFERLQQMTRLYEPQNAPVYLRTHPLTQERIADMANRVEQMPARTHRDSDGYRYARAKLRALRGLPSDAAGYFRAELKKTPDDPALRYGLAQALYLSNQPDQAWDTLAPLRDGKTTPYSPFLEQLAARIELARNAPQKAIAILEPARARSPDNTPLDYTLIEARLSAGQTARAAEAAQNGTRRTPRDIHYWTLLARARQALGQQSASHQAQAEVYALRGALPQAIDQLELARKAKDGDFYTQSAIDARLRELKEEDQQDRQTR